MRPVSRTVAALVALSWCACAAAQNTPYNTTDTFQPGKKYNCVPAADRKSWNCNEIGKTDAPAPETAAQSPPAPPSPPVSAAAPPPPPAPAASPEHSSSLPSYLTNAAASSNAPLTPPPSTISATANRAIEPPIPAKPAAPSTVAEPAPPKPRATVAAKPAPPAPAHAVAAKPAAPRRPAPVRESALTTQSASGAFMDLAGDRFVIELAHASRPSELAATRASIHVPRGELYELHFRQNGPDAWLLLWGSFDSIEAARAARGELAQSTSATVGWPRRVAPLQAEARRVSP